MFFYFCVFLVALQNMTKEVSEIIYEMEEKHEQPNENSSKLCGSNFYKVISKGDFEEMR